MPTVTKKYCSVCGEETKRFTFENYIIHGDHEHYKAPHLITQVYLREHPGTNKEGRVELDICPLCSSAIITEISKRIKQKRGKEIEEVINERKSK